MHLDVELKKNDIIRVKDKVVMTINDDLEIVVDHESRLRLMEQTQKLGGTISTWWCCPLKHPELRIRIYEENIAWVERH